MGVFRSNNIELRYDRFINRIWLSQGNVKTLGFTDKSYRKYRNVS